MRTIILDNPDQVADRAADQIQKLLEQKPAATLGLATGSTPVRLYGELIRRFRQGSLRFSRCRTFNLDEYIGLAPDHPQSYRSFMQKYLFNAIDISHDNTRVPRGDTADVDAECRQYEQCIQAAGGLDLQLLGLGENGHIGFNEPGSSQCSRTRATPLADSTLTANRRFFEDHEPQPARAITMGIGTILEARQILLLATGRNKADAVRRMLEEPLNDQVPASALQQHAAVTVLLDRASASALSHSTGQSAQF